MKKLAKQSGILAAALLAVCMICQLCTSTYTSYIPVDQVPPDWEKVRVEVDDANEERPGRMTFYAPEPKGDFAKLRMRPEESGKVWAEVRDEAGSVLAVGYYWAGPMGYVYDYTTGGFTGDMVTLIVLTVFFLGESLLLFLAFRRAKGPAFYAYSTIFTIGFSVFMLLTGIMLLVDSVRHFFAPRTFPMVTIYANIAGAGRAFMIMTSPLVLVFAAAMTVSNLALLRHEAGRLRNVLGILVSLIMAGGDILGIVLCSMNFSGSELQYRIFSTEVNVYATIYVYFECMLLGSIICGLMAARHVPEGDCSSVIVLGCGFRKDGTLTPLLRGRVDKGISWWKLQREKGVDAVLIPSGGQGGSEPMAEAEAMRRYMLSQDVPEECILPENQSANTYQNMEFSKKLIEERAVPGKTVFATTNYHVFRSGLWASLAGLEAEGIGSSTKWWFWPNAFMRECVGLMVNRWKQELALLAVLTAVFAALTMLLG